MVISSWIAGTTHAEASGSAAADRLCIRAFPAGFSRTSKITGGTKRVYDRNLSRNLVCSGSFGTPDGVYVTAGTACSIAAAITKTVVKLPPGAGGRIDWVCFGVDLTTSGAVSAGKSKLCGYLASAIGTGAGIFAAGATLNPAFGVGVYKGVTFFGEVAVCVGLVDGAARNFGVKLESNHEVNVARDIVRGKCLQQTKRPVIGLKWSAVDCPKGYRSAPAKPAIFGKRGGAVVATAATPPEQSDAHSAAGDPGGGIGNGEGPGDGPGTDGGADMVSTGARSSCAVRVGEGVFCWGGGYSYSRTATAHRISGLSSPVSLSVGGEAPGDHACAVVSDGSVWCWGWGTPGVGWGTAAVPVPRPVQVVGVSDAISVSGAGTSARDHTCTVRITGTVACWGGDDFGGLGNGSWASSSTPVTVSGLSDAAAVSAGFGHTCALRAGGSVSCWGRAGEGQLGAGDTSGSSTPVAVRGLSDAVSVSAGSVHSCAVRANRTVVCWGYNRWGALGNGSTTASSTPVAVSGLSDAVSVSAGYGHSCAVRGSGMVACWGWNDDGQLGDGTTSPSSTPTTVSGLADAVAVSAGSKHTCALRSTGSVLCWGGNDAAQLGNGTSIGSTIPVAVVDF